MTKPQRIFFLVYDGFQLLDVAGPGSVFSSANIFLGTEAYRNISISCAGGGVMSTSGVAIDTQQVGRIRLSAADTLLVSGAEETPLRAALRDEEMLNWLRRAVPKAGRFGSICSGALILAKTGALDSRSATTHWRAQPTLTKYYPQIKASEDKLYVCDGPAWTSAGATSGIDMALEMVRRDHGNSIMHAVAKHLVVYAHRPGNQSQFSDVLAAQTGSDAAFSELIAWMRNNLGRGLNVSDLAARAAMSERTFHRKFTQATGKTPAKFLDEMRLDHARLLLEAHQPVKLAAAATGFKSEGGFRAAFEEKYGISPSLYRTVHTPR